MRSIGYLPNSFVFHSLRFWQGLEMFNHETAQGPQALPQEEEVWRKLGMMRWIYGISSYDWEETTLRSIYGVIFKNHSR